MAARVDVEGSSLVLSGGSGTQKKRETLRLVELIGEAGGREGWGDQSLYITCGRAAWPRRQPFPRPAGRRWPPASP